MSFVPGNHDVWVTRGEPWADSLSKLRAVDALCDELGVRRTPAIMGGCVVAPLCAWHHAAFDREPEVTGWTGLPPASQVISDFYLCKFPGLSQTDDSVAAALDARNDDGAIAALRRARVAVRRVRGAADGGSDGGEAVAALPRIREAGLDVAHPI